MTPIQWAGAAAVAVGLVLLVFERFGRTAAEQTASVKGWKIEAQGSVALVLVVVGVLGLWLGDRNETSERAEPPASSTTTTTSTTLPPTTLVSPTTTTLPALEYMPPSPILEVWTDFDEEFCDDFALYWFDDPNADYFLIQVAAMDPIEDLRMVEWEFESWPPLCEWEWELQDYTRYWIWISAVQGDLQTVPYFVEYYTNP